MVSGAAAGRKEGSPRPPLTRSGGRGMVGVRDRFPRRRAEAMSVTQAPAARQQLVMDYVDWKTYTRLLRVFAERPGYRLTYDRGRLEIMTPLLGHDRHGRFLGRMVVVLTEELRLPILSGGWTTLRRQLKPRGLAAEQSCWSRSEARGGGLPRRH